MYWNIPKGVLGASNFTAGIFSWKEHDNLIEAKVAVSNNKTAIFFKIEIQSKSDIFV